MFWLKWRRLILAVVLAVVTVPIAYRFIPAKASAPLAPAFVRPPAVRVAASSAPPPDVWLVEKTAASETYSNGLRLDTRFTVPNHPRSYLAFSATRPGDLAGTPRSQPVGIVFHTTESRLAPFEADQNRVLQKLGESLLEYVRRKRAYHFLIDRFGRVYRVVAETDAANHAGYSVWADDQSLYVNLNESFLGVSIEAQTHPGQEQAEISPAQLRAAAMLTEMLRSKYHIAAQNCVTHAQVSVNPSNRQIGYHTDWASSFPFEQVGLPDNYARPLPALWAFGFEYNPQFLERGGERLDAGLELAEERLSQRAAAAGMSAQAYRRSLQKQYRARLEAVKRANAAASEESD